MRLNREEGLLAAPDESGQGKARVLGPKASAEMKDQQ
jgi:hypothetical protein